ncbi:uncharacterized protein LOC129250480 [Anastrepha obliqua]|uniref:uncharacterized protein LOC129250480 n=1 Tax=Anastrepha obliqua TaxID=95512 RepID=UPI002409BAB2|nr:uncharacterized protein LOC129250480 [Anastrepha obliqua]
MANVKRAASDTADAIKGVIDAFQQHIRELKALGRPVEFWDDWLVYELVNKLDFETRKQWELSLVTDEPPTFEQLFTTHRYSVTADIAKMYRQICMSTKNLDLQRIVWRRGPTSYLAGKSLQQTAKYSSHICEKAAAVIHKDFYMDDLLTGASSKEELLCLQRNVSEILKEGGFELRKWASSCAELFENVSNASENISHYLVDSKDIHALGLIWNTEVDYFTFSVNLNQPPTILTKRTFLSDASTLFDLLGLLALATIRSKMWFQEIWRMSVGWDDVLPDCIPAQWRQHRSELLLLSSLKITRWFGSGAGESFTELHIFADASERAYAAVMYARTVHNNGSITVVLISSKTKVAPLKTNPATLRIVHCTSCC